LIVKTFKNNIFTTHFRVLYGINHLRIFMKFNFLFIILCVLFITSCATPENVDPAKIKQLQEQRQIINHAKSLYGMKKYDEALTCLEPIKNNSLFSDEVFDLQRKIEVDKFLKENKREVKHTIFEGIKQVDERLVYPENYGQTISITGEEIDNTIPDGPMDKLLNKKVSMNLQNADLKQIIMAMNEEGGLNIIADSALESSEKQLTVKVEDVPLRELISYIARNMGLDFHLGQNVIWVTAGSSNTDNSPKLETRFFKLKAGAIPSLGGDNETEIEDALETFLETGPPESAFRLYRNRNLLVVKNTRDNLKIIEKLIMELDKPIQQVLIEARYLTISQTDLNELGFDLKKINNPRTRKTPIENITNNLLANDPFKPGVGGDLTLTGIIGSIEYELVVRALDEMASTQVISSPRVTVLNNQTATIFRGETRYYFDNLTPVNIDGGDFQGDKVIVVPEGDAKELETGIKFEVKPTIGNDGKKVMLNLKPTISQFDGYDPDQKDIQLPLVSENELETTAVIDSGQTVILGGIITETKENKDFRIPILGRLPLVGQFFAEEQYSKEPKNLIIFVTATIIDGSGKYINIQD
jgi:type IV pilus assembly protein PilQ